MMTFRHKTLCYAHEQRRDQFEITGIDEFLPRIENGKHQLDEAPAVRSRERQKRFKLGPVGLGHEPSSPKGDGERQSDRLQLRHPEVRYTVQGFRVTRPATSEFEWSPSAPPIPLTRLVATREDPLEPISYWMRVGYNVANSNWARQGLKLQYGLRGMDPRRRALPRLDRRNVGGYELQGAGQVLSRSLECGDAGNPGIHGRRPEQGSLGLVTQ
jgi:hypothetical protein